MMTEEEVFSGSPEEDLIDRSWKKLERELKKEGFREGALKGQEESYQIGFDLGFAEGYRLGEVLGIYKGKSSLEDHQKIEKPDVQKKKELFDNNQERRACILCQDENLLNQSVKDVLKNQRNANDIIISHFS